MPHVISIIAFFSAMLVFLLLALYKNNILPMWYVPMLYFLYGGFDHICEVCSMLKD